MIFLLNVSLVGCADIGVILPPSTDLSFRKDELPFHCHAAVLLNLHYEMPPRSLVLAITLREIIAFDLIQQKGRRFPQIYTTT